MDRQGVVHAVATAIYDGFVRDDGGDWLSRTGSVVPTRNLRAHKTRHAFHMIRAAASGCGYKRVWTKAILRDALAQMMKNNKLQVPRTSGFSWPEWLKEQVADLHSLSQKARKNAWRMDQLETLPFNPYEDRLYQNAVCQCLSL